METPDKPRKAATKKPAASRTRTSKPDRTPDRTLGVTLLSAAAAVLGLGATIAAVLLRRKAAPADGHPVPDLAADAPSVETVTTPSNAEPGASVIEPEVRAPEHFRPDPTAVPTAEEREALRPATGPAPSLAADRGSTTT